MIVQKATWSNVHTPVVDHHPFLISTLDTRRCCDVKSTSFDVDLTSQQGRVSSGTLASGTCVHSIRENISKTWGCFLVTLKRLDTACCSIFFLYFCWWPSCWLMLYTIPAVWKKQKMFLPHPHVKVNIVGRLRDREVACSASERQGSNFESCVWRTVSSQSSHHPQDVLLAQFSLYVQKGGLKPDSFHFCFIQTLLNFHSCFIW